MEIYELILREAIANDVIPSLRIDSAKLLELKCYQTILRIYEIVAQDALDDAQCFERVEEIVCALEDLGIGGGNRHDF